MPDILDEIRAWFHQQQDWLQEAAEMLLTSGVLTDADIGTIASHLKTPKGRVITAHRTFDGLGATPGAAEELRLVEIGNICGIENLAPCRPLTFGTGNLAVIYGHNGSGKSGYTRILKHVCGKPGTTELKSNVFQAPPATQSCRIVYKQEGTEQTVDWLVGSPPIGDIRTIDIFDATAATFYLSGETAVSYTPPTVALFEELARVCDQVKSYLINEQARLVSTLPALPPEYITTTAGTAYAALASNFSDVTIQNLTQWGDDNQRALEQLTERLNTLDPAAVARKKRSTKSQLDIIIGQLTGVAAAFSQERLVVIRQTRNEAEVKRRIALESARVEAAQLEGIGADTWKALWQAARLYSETAYPGQSFPVTADGSRCLLCQQELGEDAQQRLLDFEAFVQGVVEAEARTAEDAYKAALESLPMRIEHGDILTLCEAAGLNEEGWSEIFEAFWDEMGRARAILMGGEKDEMAVAIESPDSILADLTQRSSKLEREAAQSDEDANSFDRESAVNDKLNLEAQRWTSQQAAAIRSEAARLNVFKVYEELKRLANSRNISLKAGDIAEQLITQAYVDRFNRELRALGAARIRIELAKTRTVRGTTLHKLRLRGAQSGQDLPESVLSDGERRIVALAAFLADVAEKPYAAPFIFDDPISSLDHDFEWQVATRLAQLAQTRQVLVFTHRLSLYGAMEDAAKKIGDEWKTQHLQQRFIESFSGIAGHPADEAAWNANTKKANNILLGLLNDARRAGETEGASAYRMRAQAICTDFRKLLERTVEDDLLNAVVKRHRRSVTTDNRLAALPHITHEDCEFIDDLMTRYSCYEHSQSHETPTFLPEEPELRADIEALKQWRETFKQRTTTGSA